MRRELIIAAVAVAATAVGMALFGWAGIALAGWGVTTWIITDARHDDGDTREALGRIGERVRREQGGRNGD